MGAQSGHSDVPSVHLFLYKMAAAGHFEFRKSLSVAFLAISDQYDIFLILFSQNGHRAHFGCLKFTFDRISGHFRPAAPI